MLNIRTSNQLAAGFRVVQHGLKIPRRVKGVTSEVVNEVEVKVYVHMADMLYHIHT